MSYKNSINSSKKYKKIGEAISYKTYKIDNDFLWKTPLSHRKIKKVLKNIANFLLIFDKKFDFSKKCDKMGGIKGGQTWNNERWA